MTPTEIASGQQRAWSLLKKLGEGDAGEVYLVESVLDRKTAILKRPRRAAFPSDTIRQASQIETEARVLQALTRLPSGLMRPPALLDQGEPGTGYTERFFIVLSQAQGFNLRFLSRLIHVGAAESNITDTLPVEMQKAIDLAFIAALSRVGKFPELVLIRALSGLIEFLETVHLLESNSTSGRYSGILWNDVKPDHIYWDPQQSLFTIIDWGNAQFLESDGATQDRQYSRLDDFKQLLESMGGFLSDSAPQLYNRLAWPADPSPSGLYSGCVLPLKARLSELLQEETNALRQIRLQEMDLLQTSEPSAEGFIQLGELQNQIVSFGELPDYPGAERFFDRLAHGLVIGNQLGEFIRLCENTSRIPLLDPEKWHLLGLIAQIVAHGEVNANTLLSGLSDDWPAVFWDLRSASMQPPEPGWWENLSAPIRELETGPQALPPYIALNRLILSLQAAAQKAAQPVPYYELIQSLKDEIWRRWTLFEPDPPDSGLEYLEVERFFELASALMPEGSQELVRSLEQPKAQVTIVLDAWQRRDFDTARRGLRRVLVWDPDRRRVLLADRAIFAASDWLVEVRSGLKKDESLQDFVTRLELEAREMRNQVGPASWLDALLSAFSQLRKGEEPTNVMMEHPQARDDLAWLLELEPRRPILASSNGPVILERQLVSRPDQPMLVGMKESPFGKGTDVALEEPLDTWVPEARGSSARVFLGVLRDLSGQSRQAAIKLMRPERLEYALPLFREEVRILTLLGDVAGVVPLLECGFFHLEDKQQLPPEDRHAVGDALSGEVQRFGLDSVHNFLADLDNKPSQGWIPYLAIERVARENNLLLLSDTGYTRGRFLPILEGLRIAIQVCDILEAAHNRNIIYRDHKILHYYWQAAYNGVFALDWNIAKRYPQGLPETETQFDLVQFGARAMHYLFTGRSAPGALPLGPNRPEEIEAAAHSYSTHWTYDDQRLPKDIKDVLGSLLAGNYTQAKALREDLRQIFLKLSALVKDESGEI